MVVINVYSYAMVPPGPPFSASNDEKFNYPVMSADEVDLVDYPLNHEVTGAEVYFQGPFTNTSNITVEFRAVYTDTGQNISDGVLTLIVPTPQSQGYEWWNWYLCRFWIGHVSDEISRAGNIRMNVKTIGGGINAIDTNVYMNVVDTSPPPTSTVRFLSIPTAANVTVNSISEGTTPVNVVRGANSSNPYSISKTGYVTRTGSTLWPNAGETSTFSVILEAIPPPPPTSTYNFLSIPLNAQIKVDGEIIGTAPVSSTKNAFTSHQVEASKEGYVTQTQTLIWPAQGSFPYTFTLQEIPSPPPPPPPPPTSTYNFTSIPTGAIIRIDGQLAGATPISSVKDALSSHTVEASKEGYVTQTQTLIWPASGSQSYAFLLEQIPPPPPSTSLYNFGSIPFNAQIKVDGVIIGVAPINSIQNVLSSHQVEASLEGYVTQTVTLIWPESGQASYAFILEQEEEIDEFLEQQIQFWISQGFTQEQAEAIANWSINNAMTPSLQTAQLLVSNLELLPINEEPEWLTDWRDTQNNLAQRNYTDALFDFIAFVNHILNPNDAEMVSLVAPIGPVAASIPRTDVWLDETAEGLHIGVLGKYPPAIRNIIVSQTQKAAGILSVSRLWKYLVSLAGIDALATWLAADNIDESVEFQSGRIISLINSGQITKEQGLEYFDRLQGFLNRARQFINISTLANPLLWLFRGIFLDAADQSEITFSQNREIVEDYTPPEPPPPGEGTGTLSLLISPSEALVSLTGFPEITQQGNYDLPIGTYTLTASLEGYQDVTRTFFINEGEITTVSIILTQIPPPPPPPPQTGTLVLAVSPQDSLISVEGQPQINQSGTYTLNQGSYGIRVEKEGYITQTRTFFINAGETTNVSITLAQIEIPPPPPVRARVEIISEPTGAEVYINGQYRFTTTPYTIFLDAGIYVFRVQLDGYFPSEIEVELAENDNIIIPFILTELPADYPVENLPPPGIIWPPIVPPQTLPQNNINYQSPYFVPLNNYNNLFQPFTRFTEFPTTIQTEDKELLVNLETTDVYPWKGRAFSIAYQDLSNANSQIVILINNDEEALIREFLSFLELNNFTTFLGYKTVFDYRWLYALILKYRLNAKKLLQMKMKDIKQLLDQVIEEFVYFPDKTGTLDDWGKYLFGLGKLTTQETLLKEFLVGNEELIRAFQTRQIELERNLYALTRFVDSNGTGTLIPPISPQTSIPGGAGPYLVENNAFGKICPTCSQINPKNSANCIVCGARLNAR